MSINRIFLSERASALFGVNLNEDQLDCFEAYYDAVIDANKEFNLTAITQKDEFVEKHFLDSLAAVSYIPQGATLLDVGSGAGFPAFPIAVARPDVAVTAMDSTAKKMTFVASSSRAVGVKNITTLSARAEDCRTMFSTFDAVVARAVSALPILLEICVPLLKVQGIFIAYKTDESELETSKNALLTLGCAVKDTFSFNLPSGDKRTLIVIEKQKSTPAVYPRQYGAIKKKPL